MKRSNDIEKICIFACSFYRLRFDSISFCPLSSEERYLLGSRESARLFFEKPEWLNEEGTWNVMLVEKENTSFILKNTETSNGGLTFIVAIQPEIERSMGTFLSNRLYEEGGGYHYYSQAPLWKIYSQDKHQLDMNVIAIGQGDRQFSFTLCKKEIADAEGASKGLNIQFNGIVSYEYVRT